MLNVLLLLATIVGAGMSLYGFITAWRHRTNLTPESVSHVFYSKPSLVIVDQRRKRMTVLEQPEPATLLMASEPIADAV